MLLKIYTKNPPFKKCYLSLFLNKTKYKHDYKNAISI